MKTKTQESHALKLSSRWTYPESESVGIMSDKKCFGDVSGWSRATVWFKRPNDVKQNRVSNPVRNLQALAESVRKHSQNQSQAESGKVMTGVFAGIVRLGERLEGESAADITAAIAKRFGSLVSKGKPSQSELAEVAYLRACKAKETKARLAFLAKAIKAKR